jgi:hypothetical protein
MRSWTRFVIKPAAALSSEANRTLPLRFGSRFLATLLAIDKTLTFVLLFVDDLTRTIRASEICEGVRHFVEWPGKSAWSPLFLPMFTQL